MLSDAANQRVEKLGKRLRFLRLERNESQMRFAARLRGIPPYNPQDGKMVHPFLWLLG